MPVIHNTPNDRYIGDEFQTAKGYIRVDSIAAPTAPGNTNIHAAITLPTSGTTTVTTGITNPDVPRVVRVKGNASGITGNVVVVGTDNRDQALTETIVAVDATAVDGVKAFKTVTSITVPVRTQSSDTISLGYGAALGLTRKTLAGIDMGLKGTVDGVHEATRPTFVGDATDIAKNIVTFNTASNGAKNFKAVYIATELKAST